MFRFFWPATSLTPAVNHAMETVSARPVCDLTGAGFQAELEQLDRVSWLADSLSPPDYYLDLVNLPNPDFQRLFSRNPAAKVWLTDPAFPSAKVEQARQLGLGRIGWVVSSLSDLQAIMAVSDQENCFAIKGNEAGGIAGADTLFTLYAAVLDWLEQAGKKTALHVWGGVATPEAAAAFIATGAAGVFFESVHWLTDLVGLPEACQKKIEQLRPDHTRLIGLQCQKPCRVFDKGNSRAAKLAQQYAFSSKETQDWLNYLQDHLISPLHSRWGTDQLIPLSVEATFAQSFVRRFGHDFVQAVQQFQHCVRALLDQRQQIANRFADSNVARAWGTRFPIIQGGMSWISDEPAFAAAVAEAGALPTLALGMMDAAALQDKFGQLATQLAGHPYILNIITLAENRQRDAQLAWILSHRPRFAVIAAGEPAQGKLLLAAGIELIYIAPNEELMRLALEAGYRYIICEGCESGGHVGTNSTLVLAQLAGELKRQRPELFVGRTLILAGGICNRTTAQMAAMLGADAIQMGTAYLITEEIVATGTLSPGYQQQILAAGHAATVVTGESVGLRVRALRNEKTRAILQLEQDFAANRGDDQDFRCKLEQLATGSLLIASRQIDARSGQKVEAAVAASTGQFMSGACAGLLNETKTLAELHANVVGIKQPARSGNAQPERIAITGMSQVNSLGNSPAEVWQASLALRSGVVAVPPEKWDHERYFDSRPMVSGKTYCRFAAFQHLTVNRRDIDVPPQDFKNMTTATKLALWAAKQAIADAGILQSNIDRQKIGVILSQNATEMTPISGDLAVRDAIPDILAAIRRVIDVSPEQAAALAEEIAAGRSIQDDTSLLGRLSSMVPGFICNKFGFTGPSYSVLAACSSSLVALHSAVQLMRNGILDAALVGGAEEPLSALHFLEFSVLGALAGITGQVRPPAEMSRPFDQDRDGFVMGEGAGMIMLERESVARRRGARIYGYITGVGASNTETGMVESSRHSQIRAIKASFSGLTYGPEAVDLIECHATATRQGDLEEVRALQELYPANKQTVLAGFKSQIGHTLGAAGINSLIRGVMAMNAGIYPATLNCACPDPAVKWRETGFVVLDKPAEWKKPIGRPRRFQVDAFGFGGSNFVVQLEQEENGADQAAEISASPAACLPGIQIFSRSLAGKKYDLAILADSLAAAERLLAQSSVLENASTMTDKRRRSLARQGIYVSRPDSLSSRVALVFPGQGSQYVGMGKQLCDELPEIRQTLVQASEHFGFDICRLLFESSEDKLKDTRWQQPAIFALEVAIAGVLLSRGLQPVVLAGHSLGQFSALCIAGAFSFADGCKIVNQRALCMEKTGRLSPDAGAMLAVHAASETIEPLLAAASGVFLLNRNSPLQTVVGGDTLATLTLAETLSTQGIRSTRLPVAMAFHSPMFQAVALEFAEFLQTIPFLPPMIPVLSNHTGGVFPTEGSEIRRLLAEHLYSPVDWLQNVKALRADYSVDLFVEAGPRETLGNMIRDSLQQADCLPTCLPSIEFSVLQNAMAQLFTAGCLPQIQPQQAVLPHFMPKQAAETQTVLETTAALSPATATDSDCPVPAATLDAVIAVIVQTTGYEPDEVSADMDLRDDLAIRSSRLPVIADALETRFAISLDLQDFAGVRTVRDIAGRIELIRQRRGGATAKQLSSSVEQQAAPEMIANALPPRRIIFSQEPLPEAAPDYLQFSPLDKIGLVCPKGGWRKAKAAAAVLKRDYGVTLIQVDSPEQAGAGLAGLLLYFDDRAEQNIAATPQLIDSFLLIQAFVMQPTARAILVLDQSAATTTERSIVVAGVEGILLSLAWEYRSLLLRSLHLAAGTVADQLIRRGLDQNIKPLILFGSHEGIFGEMGREASPVVQPAASWQLGPEDVVVISGGGAGILQEWVRALIPLGCRIILLGRTQLVSGAEPTRSAEIKALLEELTAVGIEAIYLHCDVADTAQTEAAMAAATEKFGRISGVIHGAGFLRDNYLPQITAEEFSAVMNVKLQGAQNLLMSSQGRGLRFFTAVSSVAAVNGNAGQVAYAAANRAMTGYLELMQRQHPQIRCQSLLLGPVEGGGMADTEEIRALMRWSGYSYIHAREVAQLFCREMVGSVQNPPPVLLVKEMPFVPTAPVEKKNDNTDFAAIYPMLDEVILDLRTPSLSATRCFQATRDRWLPEHRPLTMLKQPLVSGIMMVEMFAEAARALYPYLSLQSIRNVKFLDRIDCPADQPRHSRIQCQRAEMKAGSLYCRTELHTQELSPTGRALERWSTSAVATVVIGSPLAPDQYEESPLLADTLAAPSVVDRAGLLSLYEQFTGLTGRYRVLQRISSFSGGMAEATVTLETETDFTDRLHNNYQTSPYLLEAMFQAVVFQTLLEQQGQAATIALPYAVGEIQYHQQGASQGNFKLQVRRRGEDPAGTIWDARVVNEAMEPVVAARGLEMRWLSL